MITTGESDSHLDGIDGGDLAAARVEVLLEVRQEDAKARKIYMRLDKQPSGFIDIWDVFTHHHRDHHHDHDYH